MRLDHFNPRGGDHRSTVDRFGPLAAGDPTVDKACVICSEPLAAGDIPTLISLAPADVEEATKQARGKPFTAVAGLSHQDCAWPGALRRTS